MKRAVPYIVGIGELQRHASTVIRTVDAKYREGFIVSHNEPQAVLMSLKRYEQLKSLEKAKRLEENEVLSMVREGDREFESGETRKIRSLKQLL